MDFRFWKNQKLSSIFRDFFEKKVSENDEKRIETKGNS